MLDNFVKFRRGILEHMMQNRFCITDFAVYSFLLLKADSSNGVVWTKAATLADHFEDGNVRTMQNSLRRLAERGYIKSFQQKGSRSSYPIMINKYEITSGVLKGGVTNAEQSVDWERPIVSGGAEMVRTWCGRGGEVVGRAGHRIQDVQDIQDLETVEQSNGAERNAPQASPDCLTEEQKQNTSRDLIHEIIDAYPMKPFTPEIQKKWELAVYNEIDVVCNNPGTRNCSRQAAAEYLLRCVQSYAAVNPEKKYGFEKFMKDGLYDRDWKPLKKFPTTPMAAVSEEDNFRVMDYNTATGKFQERDVEAEEEESFCIYDVEDDPEGLT